MKIAIVGAGVSGLTVAHLLHRDHAVTVFEAGDYAGGHTNTVRVDTEHETHHVDTGFIVYNDRNYPNFERLLRRIGVEGQPSDMSFAVSDEKGDFEYASTSANGLYAKRSHLATPWFQRMIADVLRFQRSVRELLQSPGAGPSLGHWLEEQKFSRPFVERVIVPQA
ncbi:MAG: FAD-dependent oxidoreductase [Solirubrobacteraceae bacterium]